MVPTPSTDAFAALARSSPWRWSTLRFTVGRPADPWKTGAVRARLRRPDALRVDTLAGDLLQVVREAPPGGSVSFVSGGGRGLPRPVTAEGPVRRADGLIAERPRGASYDAPMYQDYFWVAMLDPVELADPHPDTAPGQPPLVVDTVTEVHHGGRLAWEAVVRPTPAYEPRCGCCALLRSREVDLQEWGEGENLLATYPDAYRVRLDVGTGVCVLTEAIGGTIAGAGHDLRIEAVDEPMDDGLFVAPRPPRLSGWSVGPGRVP